MSGTYGMRTSRRYGNAVVRRLRGWGGVAGMAVAVALVLTAVCVLVPSLSAGSAASPEPHARGVAEADQAADADCAAPEASLRPSTATGASIEKIKERGYLIAGVDQNSFRWGYRDPNKPGSELEGFDIDLAHEIAASILGDEDAIRFKAIPTNQRVPALKEGKVDMVVRTMTITCERAKEVAFSTAYFETGQQVLAPKDSPIEGYDKSLAGQKVCTAEGSTALAQLKRKSFGADISTTVPNQLDCLVRLQLGEVDAVVTDSALAAGQAAQDPTVELKGGKDGTFTKEFYGVAMNHEADDLVRRVNAVLADWRKSGWKASYAKWLAADLGAGAAPPEPKYR